MDHHPSPAFGYLLEYLVFFLAPGGLRFAAGRPVVEMGQSWDPPHPRDEHLQPVETRHKDWASPRRVVIARLDPLQAAGFAGAHRTQAFRLQAFRPEGLLFFYPLIMTPPDH
jgi:hypothetical protein